MVIKSKVNSEEYFYVKIPKTGTQSYTKLFFMEMYPEYYEEYNNGNILHSHDRFNSDYRGITVVRNPYNRFISILKFLNSKINNNISYVDKKIMDPVSGTLMPDNLDDNFSRYDYTDIFKSEDFFYDFFYSSFGRNCEVENKTNVQLIFNTSGGNFINSFFTTQVEWAYHPKIQIFKYEKIEEFNRWIENIMGYDISKLEFLNKSGNHNNINIDFNSKKFKELTTYLFYDDFRYFDYQFPI
jgi:hypothetical protein